MHCVSVGGGVHVTHRCRGDRVGAGLRLKRSRLSCRSRLSLLSRLQGCGVVDVSVVVRSSLGWAGVFGGDGDGGMQGSAHREVFVEELVPEIVGGGVVGGGVVVVEVLEVVVVGLVVLVPSHPLTSCIIALKISLSPG